MIRKLRYIFSRKDKIKLVLLLVMITGGSFMELLGVTVFMPFIQVVMNMSYIHTNKWLSLAYNTFHFNSDEMFLAVLALGICAVYVIKNVYLSLMQNMVLKFSYSTRMDIATRLLVSYMEEPYTFHLGKNVAEMQRSLQMDTNQFMLLINAALQMVAEVMVCLIMGIYLFDTSHSITAVVGGLLIICVGFFFIIAKRVSHRLGRKNEIYNAKLMQWINQSLGGIKEVKVLHREKYFVDEYRENYKVVVHGAKLNELLAALPKYIVETVCISGLLLAVILKMFFGFQGKEVSDFIPQLAAFAVAAFRLMPSIGKLNAYFNNIMYCLPSLDLIYKDLTEVQDAEQHSILEQADESWIFQKEIRISHVTYHYPDTNVPVLKDIDFSIKKGETVAFIGSSGAGKTTLADIILGLLEPSEGRIMADDLDVFKNLATWHKQLGYIPQSIYLSDDTIRNNIAFGIKEQDIDDKAVEEAARKAQLYDFVDSLDKGFNTFVGDRGVRLSGGQRQRIGIARALYHNPSILVLDEATSALDNETEQAVMEAIDSLRGEKTMIIIAHRLTTIRNVDIIYEVGGGKITQKNKSEVLGTE